MIRAEGFRLLRVIVDPKSLASLTPENARRACMSRGLLLDAHLHNPAFPYRHRKTADGEVHIEQVQMIVGQRKFVALLPPDQPDFLERFAGGEPWVGVTKTARV